MEALKDGHTARGPVIRADGLSTDERLRVWKWLQANGCRWQVPCHATIKVKGRHIEVECFTIRDSRQAKTLWPRRIPEDWEPPTKFRRFRNRIPLNR